VATLREVRGPDASRPSCRRPAERAEPRTREGVLPPRSTWQQEPKEELKPESRTPRNAQDRAGLRRQADVRRDDSFVCWMADWPTNRCDACDCGRCGGRAHAGGRDDRLPRGHCAEFRMHRNRQCGAAHRWNGRSNHDGRAATMRLYWRTDSSPTRSKPGFSAKWALSRALTNKPSPTRTNIRVYAHFRWNAIGVFFRWCPVVQRNDAPASVKINIGETFPTVTSVTWRPFRLPWSLGILQ